LRFNFATIKLNRALILLLPLAVLSLVAFSCVTPSGGGGCGGPASQGWSGFASYNGTLYFGSMDGRVFAVDPSARNREVTFPGEGEWVFAIEAPAAPGSMCGPLGCAPASVAVNIYSTPAVTDNLVYAGTYYVKGGGAEGKVLAVSPSARGEGRVFPVRKENEWVYPHDKYEAAGAIVGDLALDESAIYIGSSDGKVYALDTIYGDLKWEFETGDKIWTSPVVKDGVVYVGNYGGNFYALSSQDGSLLWEIELPAAIASSPVVSGGSVFFGTFDHYLYAINSANGVEKWRFKGGNWFWANPVVKDGVVYAGCLDHRIYALGARTGTELWQFTADAPIVSTPVLAGNLLIAVSKSGEMYVLEANSGALERTVSIGYEVMAPLYAEENMVYVHARNRCVYSVDVQSGEKVWELCYSDID